MALSITKSGEHAGCDPTLYESTLVASAQTLEGTLFSIRLGLSEELAAKLKARSLDESDGELMNNTSDRRRFGEGSYETWFGKGRVPFALVDQAGELAALIWYGAEMPPAEAGLPPGRWDTIAFRAYLPYRGAGIMGDFTRFVLAWHVEHCIDAHLWLETDATNEAGIRLYERTGFVRKGEHEGRVVMARE